MDGFERCTSTIGPVNVASASCKLHAKCVTAPGLTTIAAHVAHAMKRIDDARLAYHYKVVRESYNLAVTPAKSDHQINRQELIELMRHDKKAVSGLTFVLDGPQGIEVVSGVGENYLHESFDAMQLP